MTYKLSRSKKLVERIELDDGTLIDININVGEMSLNFNKEYNKVTRIKLLETNAENIELLGQAAIDFYAFVLGKENVEKLIDYYDNNYLEMIEQITPFVEDVVKPTMIKYIKEKNRIAGEKYKKRKK